jgi:hypothetical protein
VRDRAENKVMLEEKNRKETSKSTAGVHILWESILITLPSLKLIVKVLLVLGIYRIDRV